jgi:hypothetical protein
MRRSATATSASNACIRWAIQRRCGGLDWSVSCLSSTVAASLACALLGADPAAMVGLGAGADTALLDRKRAVVVGALPRARALHGTALRNPLVALAALGGPELAVLAGVVLDAAAAGAWWSSTGWPPVWRPYSLCTVNRPLRRVWWPVSEAGDTATNGPDPAGLRPLLDLRIRAGERVGACLAATVLRQGLAIRAATARVNYPAPGIRASGLVRPDGFRRRSPLRRMRPPPAQQRVGHRPDRQHPRTGRCATGLLRVRDRGHRPQLPGRPPPGATRGGLGGGHDQPMRRQRGDPQR